MPTIKRPSIPRDTFVAAIERGIANAFLSGPAAEKLRKIGRESKLIGVGIFSIPGTCYCPLSKAGLVDYDGDPTPSGGLSRLQVPEFAGAFDDYIVQALRERSTIDERNAMRASHGGGYAVRIAD